MCCTWCVGQLDCAADVARTWAVHVLVALVSRWFWSLYLAIPACASSSVGMTAERRRWRLLGVDDDHFAEDRRGGRGARGGSAAGAQQAAGQIAGARPGAAADGAAVVERSEVLLGGLAHACIECRALDRRVELVERIEQRLDVGFPCAACQSSTARSNHARELESTPRAMPHARAEQ